VARLADHGPPTPHPRGHEGEIAMPRNANRTVLAALTVASTLVASAPALAGMLNGSHNGLGNGWQNGIWQNGMNMQGHHNGSTMQGYGNGLNQNGPSTDADGHALRIIGIELPVARE
jgi:hypothetical protein